MNYTQEEIEKAFKITREIDSAFWEKCANHVKEAVGSVVGSTHCTNIRIFGSWYFTIGGFERGFIGCAVVEIDLSVKLGYINRIAFYADSHDGMQKEFTYTE